MAAKAGTTPKSPPPAAGGQSPPPKGHNLSAEQQEALFLSHMNTIRGLMKPIEELQDQIKAARKPLNVARSAAEAEGFPLHMIDRILKDEAKGQKGRKALMAEAELELRLRSWAGLPIGGQAELFATTPEEVKDAIAWEADGYQAGIRALEPKPPKDCPPRYHQEWMKGYHAGQERNAWALSEKGKIVDRRTDIAPGKVDLEPEPDDEDEAAAAGEGDDGGEGDDEAPIPGEQPLDGDEEVRH